MPDDKAVFTYPPQHVRAGRGTPGYTGNVRLTDSKKKDPEKAAKLVTTGDKPKVVAAKVDGLAERRALVAKAKELGIPASGSNAELQAAIEAASK